MIRRLAAVLMWLAIVGAPLLAFQQPSAPDGFVPVTEVPASEQLPAAPFLIAAYAFFLVLMIGYVWSVARRLSRVEKDMAALDRKSARSGPP